MEKEAVDADDNGRGASALAVFLRLAIEGWNDGAPGAGMLGRPGIAGAAPGGGLGAENDGSFGAGREVSGSER